MKKCWVLCQQSPVLKKFLPGYLLDDEFEYCSQIYRVFVDEEYTVWFLPTDFDWQLAVRSSRPKTTQFTTYYLR